MTKRILGLFHLTLALATAFGGPASARAFEPGKGQGEKQATCSGPVYKAKDVSRQAKVTDAPLPEGESEDERDGGTVGRVVLKAVLCRTGEVTDIEVVEGLPDGLTEKAVEAARRIKFVPAERRGQKASQRAIFEYTFRYLN